MFWKKKKKTSPNDNFREVLFGDASIGEWVDDSLSETPWPLFSKANNLIESGQNQDAISVLKQIVEMKELESRHYIQTYNFLRRLGYVENEPTKLLGVVVEVGINNQGYDLLAAYSDLTVRYYNYTGKGILWERPDDSIDKEIKHVLSMGEEVLKIIGVGENEKQQPVKKGVARLNLLTSKGLTFGEGPMSALSADPVGGGLLHASAILMQALIKKVEN